MASNFQRFGPIHLAILAAIPAVSAGLGRCARWSPRSARRIRIILGVCLAANELTWWAYRYSREGIHLENLPLQLSDLTVWTTVIALFTLARWPYEFAYYAGLTGAGMAVLTPDLWAPFPSYPSIYFFLEHGGVLISVLVLTWSKLARPQRGSVWRAFAVLHVWAVCVGVFDAISGANYMYLRSKPASGSILDYLGPWPVYLIAADALSLILFGLLWLPFRQKRAATG